ncbi:cation-transporting ATPase [Spiroplasma sp. NBRC 100390]|uniref:cation-translocating P-type ATPase n=1 Tax=unclassified Spiroplasma TaxID=2637901 RepID=UPI000892871A|nr:MULTISPECIES: cation-translocating P-type ATPase [unclassified Spiroplasma]AOX43891.1 cation-transporting ATPase [Spiroplasma sp. TU-14]APE13361.1 cation-transporting ATPase [Spiroplasma sp. NBRC 100390]
MEEYISQDNNNLESSLQTNFEIGLSSDEVTIRQKQYGKNELPKGKVTPWYVIFGKALIEPLQLILIAAAVISVIAPMVGNNWKLRGGYFVDFTVIGAIVILDAILETVQTVKARKSMAALKSLSKPKAVVIRNDLQQEIPAHELTVGDIVVLEAGKYVPAELRIIEQSDVFIDEAILTGESVPVHKTDKPIEATTILAEMKNIAFMSTFITAGRAVGVVIKVGQQTEIGKIATTINETEESPTNLEKKLTKFSYWIAGLSFIIAIMIFIALYFSGNKSGWTNYLMVAITLAIGVIPESLAAVVSITLSFSTKRMAKQNVIVKKLASMETLGSVNVICTDKTGTLTENKMTVKKVIMDNSVINAEAYQTVNHDQHQDLFLKALVLCNDSVTEDKERIGDPTELALVDYAELFAYDEQDSRDKWERIDEVPFDSERKLMSTLNIIDGVSTTFTKGALDSLLQYCDRIMIKNQILTLTDEHKAELLKLADDLSTQALRVLAFAYNTNFDDEQDPEALETNLIFLGAVGMIDPVRCSAIEAVKKAHAAGIEVVMITGDHATTALAIAKELNLAYSEYEVISSEQLNEMSDKQLIRIIDKIKVFARVNPEHKVRIVNILQQKKYLVSMTGDGVNDAPSLVKADIGVAMGITGTDVAKQAADVILTDDNFETIIKGVNEGRNVYQKIRRAISFVIGVNLANVLSIFILSLINHVSPVEATDILWMNLVIESILAICIGMGDNDDTLMRIKPLQGKNSLFRNIWGPTLRITILTSAVCIGAYYFGMSFVPAEAYQPYGYQTVFDFLRSNDPMITVEMKLQISDFGRTSMFLVLTCAPSMLVNTVTLSDWKIKSQFKSIINRPLTCAAIGAVLLNIIMLFIPWINNKVLNLNDLEVYSKSNWYFVPACLAMAMIPVTVIIVTDALYFWWHHNLKHYFQQIGQKK